MDRALVDCLVRGFEKYGGDLRLRTHCEEILVEKKEEKKKRLGS